MDGRITEGIHKQCGVVATYAYSFKAFVLLRARYQGEWKYLEKILFEYTELTADQALLELATLLRVLDDKENIGEWEKSRGVPPYGEVHSVRGIEDLFFRDMTNKIIHAVRFEWKLDRDDPRVVLHAKDGDRWIRADLNIERLLQHCAVIMS